MMRSICLDIPHPPWLMQLGRAPPVVLSTGTDAAAIKLIEDQGKRLGRSRQEIQHACDLAAGPRDIVIILERPASDHNYMLEFGEFVEKSPALKALNELILFVHSWIVFVLNKEWDKSLARLALTCVASEVPDTNEKHWWLLQRRLLQHATRQNVFIADGKLDMDRLDWGFHHLGSLYSNQGKLVEAEQTFQRALQGREAALGPEHTSTLNTVHCLGTLYKTQGKLVEAEQIFQRELQGYEKVVGPNHPKSYSLRESIRALDTPRQGKAGHKLLRKLGLR